MSTDRARKSRAVALGVTVALVGAAFAAAPASAATRAPRGAARSAAASSKLTLGHSTGLPRQSVSFAGHGFRRKEKVELHWRNAGGPRLTTVTASGSGAISGHFHVPLPWAGVPRKLSVVAVGTKSRHQDKAGFAQQCSDEWTDTSGGDWSNAGRWSTGAVPSSSDATCITLAGSKSYTVTLSNRTNSTTVGSVIVGATSGRTTQTLRMLPNGSDMALTLNRTSEIDARGSFVMSSDGNGNSFLEGAGTLENYGHFGTVPGAGWSRYLYSPIVNEPSGNVDLAMAKGQCCIYDNSTVVNKGTFTVASGATFHTNDPASFTQTAGRIVNNGTIEADGGTRWTQTGGAVTGHAVLISFSTGAILDNGAGTGSYDVINSTTLANKLIPAGQRITVVGDAGGDVALTLTHDTTNDGVLTMTSKSQFGGSGNSFINGNKAASQPYTLTNHGTIATVAGAAYSRYLEVNIVNAADGTLEFGNPIDQSGNPTNYTEDVTNAGTLDFAAGVQMALSGDASGGSMRDFVQTSTGVLNVVTGNGGGQPTLSDTQGNTVQESTAPVFQYGCGGATCHNQALTVGGTVNLITGSSTPPTSYYVVWGDMGAGEGNSPVSGTFSKVGAGYTATYNNPGRSVRLDS